jgi:lipopolysaccharide biosynthesis glycosyltransferase
VTAAVEGTDFIIAKGIPVVELGASTVREHWHNAEMLPDADYECMIKIIEERHPDLAPLAEAYSAGDMFYPCNMVIMSKKLLDVYFPILFDVMDEFERRTDMSRYSIQGLRTTGHLAERLFGMFYLHAMRAQLVVKELEVAYFKDTSRIPERPQPSSSDAVGIVFASNDAFVPCLDVALASLYENASPQRNYDIAVFTTDISAANERVLMQRAARYGNMSLRIINVRRFLADKELSTKAIVGHISVETFYRFLILDIMAAYHKVLYLDCDLLIQADVGDLYDHDLGDCLIGAVIDADYLANLNLDMAGKVYDEAELCGRLKYSREVLGMQDPYGYFQAGVLLFNVDELRRVHDSISLINMAASGKFDRYLDQDILNSVCDGRVSYLPMEWNALVDHHLGIGRKRLILDWAPADIAKRYMSARANPRIIHYAGPEKPWNYANGDFSREYWAQARTSPYYEQLVANMASASVDARIAGAVQSVTLTRLVKVARGKARGIIRSKFRRSGH